MKKIVFFMLLIGFCAAIIAPGAHAGESTAQYSAVETINTLRGFMTAKVFVAPGMKRMEMQGTIQILRFDKGVMWMLMPEEGMYTEQPISMAPGGSAKLKFIERTKLGQETVNGIKATKYKTVAVDPEGNRLEGFSWQSAEGILVKSDMKSQSMMVKTDLSELKVGSQNPALFEVPEGLNKLTMPSGMGKGMPGGASGGMPGGFKMPTRPGK